jgi:hypothetical protein
MTAESELAPQTSDALGVTANEPKFTSTIKAASSCQRSPARNFEDTTSKQLIPAPIASPLPIYRTQQKFLGIADKTQIPPAKSRI